MDTPVLTVYRELADHYERLGQSSMRDRFLMLAADAALSAGHGDEAERLRQRLLAGNRHHMLRPYSSFEEASRAADVQAYLEGLRANYPPEQASDMLNSLRGGDETPQPPAARAIPPTAPLLDMNAAARQQRPLDETRPFQPMQVDAAPQRSPRPRSQPAPPRPAGAPPVAQTQPLREIPLDVPPPKKKEPPPPRPVPPPVRRAQPEAPPPPKVGPTWLNVTLSVVTAAAALAAAAFTLGRPWLP